MIPEVTFSGPLRLLKSGLVICLSDLCTISERAAPDAPERIYYRRCRTRMLPLNVVRRIARERVPTSTSH